MSDSDRGPQSHPQPPAEDLSKLKINEPDSSETEPTVPESDSETDSQYGTPTEGSEVGNLEVDQFSQDILDEEQLHADELSLSPDELQARHLESQSYKQQGNLEFGNGNYQDSVNTYTKALRICPLKQKEFRSVLYANRSAAKIKMGLSDSAIEDCSQAIENNPNYVRALLRRGKLYEQVDKLDEALADYQKVVELDPGVPEARAALARLPEQINERNEKLKTEMLGKLKDLGNMVLKPFGLSTDNFQLNQDPSGSGGYSINFKK